MAGSWPREAARPRSPEGSRRGGSQWVIAPVCLLLALSMETMCAQIWPQSVGMVSKETVNSPSGPEGAGGMERPEAPTHQDTRHQESIKTG